MKYYMFAIMGRDGYEILGEPMHLAKPEDHAIHGTDAQVIVMTYDTSTRVLTIPGTGEATYDFPVTTSILKRWDTFWQDFVRDACRWIEETEEH